MTNTKKKIRVFGNNYYFLGTDKKGTHYWLEESAWDCDWYWSYGYVETFTNNNNPTRSKDISSHSFFELMFFKNGNVNAFDAFKSFFVETPFTNNEIWKILELIKSLSIIREYSDTLHRGGAHFTSNPASEFIKSEDEYNRINKVVIPKINEELYKILSEEE